MKIIQNKIKCLKCEEEIESLHRHDFLGCICGAVAVDGGKDYLRRVGDMDKYEDLSTYELDATDLEEMKNEGSDKSLGEELPERPALRIDDCFPVGEGDPLGIPLKIYSAENGYIVVDSEAGDADKPMVFEEKDETVETEALVDLLWYLKNALQSEPEGKYSRDRIHIIVEVGEKYELKEGERLVETTHLRVRGNLETNDFDERTLTKKEMEGE